MEATLAEDRIKDMLEEVFVKMMREQKGAFYDIVMEALEDIALGNAIQQGRRNRFIFKRRILAALK